ncbi:MAG: hypothetical protein ACHQWU_05605 [Gemmatimonadales bacterium]
MMHLTNAQYDLVERAVAYGTRIAVFRQGREFIVIPLTLASRDGREAIETRNPMTGHDLTIYLDEIERLDVVE